MMSIAFTIPFVISVGTFAMGLLFAGLALSVRDLRKQHEEERKKKLKAPQESAYHVTAEGQL